MRIRIPGLVGVLLVIGVLTGVPTAQAPVLSQNVVVITIDGYRWQEMFSGAALEYFKRDSNDRPGAMEQRFWRSSPHERRAVLTPFLWNDVATTGQIFGDPGAGSRAHVTNGLWFSYPGYNEMFAGVADSRIDSNRKLPNPNITVLEWLNSRPGLKGKVAAFGAWDVLPFILNTERSGIPVGTGFKPVPAPSTDRERAINELATDLPPYWGYGTLDAPMVYASIEALRTSQPRVLYLMLGEGDEWAHENKYDFYLESAHRSDQFIRRIWDTLQSLPAYAGKTTLLVTTDHGRGATVKDWSDHGRDVPAAENTWFAAIGPSVPALGVRRDVTVTTAQLAATIAAVIGEDFSAVAPKAAPPLPLRR
ncbi:MAG: hypothetical protein HQ485_13185 [Acidobacteria bacterium]|jgi:hypothetical protein|nr:hypothetical protein [Acidobacteriota bacterium]